MSALKALGAEHRSTAERPAAAQGGHFNRRSTSPERGSGPTSTCTRGETPVRSDDALEALGATPATAHNALGDGRGTARSESLKPREAQGRKTEPNPPAQPARRASTPARTAPQAQTAHAATAQHSARYEKEAKSLSEPPPTTARPVTFQEFR